jgi:hypothetical protein
MAASSVTGVGPGSADRVNKGSEHMHLGVDHLIGPRVVDAGQAALTSGTPSTANVPFTKALTSATGYYAHVQPVGSTSGAGAAGLAVSNVATSGFGVTGPNSSTQTFNWILIYSPDGTTVGAGQVGAGSGVQG